MTIHKKVDAASKTASTKHNQVHPNCISCTKVYHYRKTIRRVRAEAGLALLLVVIAFLFLAIVGLRYQLVETRARRLQREINQLHAVQKASIPDYSNNAEAIAALEAGWAQGASASEFGSGD